MIDETDGSPMGELKLAPDPFAGLHALPSLESGLVASTPPGAPFERFATSLDLKPAPAHPTLAACLDRLPVAHLDRVAAALEVPPKPRRREREHAIAASLLRADHLMDLVAERLGPAELALLELLLSHDGQLSAPQLLQHQAHLVALHPEWFLDEVDSPLRATRALGLVYAALDAQGQPCALIPLELRQLLGLVLS